jgi:thioredoxin 1
MVPADPTIIREDQKGASVMSNATAVTDQDFDAEVLKSSTPVLVDFWAEWCGPCKLIAPAVDQISAEYAGRLKVVKMNVDENPGIPIQFGIQGIPTLLLFKGGQVVEKIVGAAPKPALLARIKPHV